MADVGQPDHTTDLEMAPAGTMRVRCPGCHAVIGECAPVPGLLNVYHCRACGKWSTLFIPPLSVLRRVVAIADGEVA